MEEKDWKSKSADFIERLAQVRRQKKIAQKDIPLAQKVVSRMENHEVDPRLSTVLLYLDAIGCDINNVFKEVLVMKKTEQYKYNRPTTAMMEHLNLKLEKEGSCLRYVEVAEDGNMKTYELRAVDKFIDCRMHQRVDITPEFDEYVRGFFAVYDVANTGYSNTIGTVFVED